MSMLNMFSCAKARYIIAGFIVMIGLVACQKNDGLARISIGDRVMKVDYARTTQEKINGLMFVEQMPEDYGMVFTYPAPEITKYWMKNTLIPLDILFFDENAKLIHIERNATPHDLSPRGPDTPVCVVVEINGGMADKMGIKKGDVLIAKDAQECLQSSLN